MPKAVKVIPKHECDVVLTINLTEAKILRKLFQHICGHINGPRGIIDGIDDALRECGVEIAHIDVTGVIRVPD